MGKQRGKAEQRESLVDYSHMPTLGALRQAFENYGDGKIFAVADRAPGELDVIKFEVARQLVVNAPDGLVEFRVKVAVLCLQAFRHVRGMNYSTEVKFLCYIAGQYRDLAVDCPPFVPEYGTQARQMFMESAPKAVFVASENVRHELAMQHPPMRPLTSSEGKRGEDD